MSLSLVSDKSALLHDGYIHTIENCCVCTLFAMQCSIIALRHLVRHEICYAHNTIVTMCLIQHEVVTTYITLQLSTIANIRHCILQMSKACYWGLKLSIRKCKQVLIKFLPVNIFVKAKYARGAWSLYIFFHNHNYLGGTGKFIYKASILDNKQLLSNIDRSQSYTSTIHHQNCLPCRQLYICSNYPVILCITTIASYIGI